MARKLLLAGLGVFLASFGLSATFAQAPQADSSVVVSCMGIGNWVLDAEPSQIVCNDVINTSYGTTSGSAVASTIGETTPGFKAISSVETSDDAITPELTYAYARVDLRYSFMVQEIAAPPFSVDTVPITFQTNGLMERSGDTNTYGFLGVMDSSHIFNGINVDANTTSLDQERSDSYLQGLRYDVWLNLECFSSVDGSGASSCLATATALIVFNQALFDQQHGAESFTLSDYLSIELSPGLTAVPLPGAIWLFTPALSGIFFLFSRRAA